MAKKSKAIYWGVVRAQKISKNRRIWPMRLHFRAHDAKMEAFRWNEMDKTFKRPKNYIVQRFILETDGSIHYDIYKHETKRI